MRKFMLAVLVVVWVLIALSTIGIDIGPLLAGAGAHLPDGALEAAARVALPATSAANGAPAPAWGPARPPGGSARKEDRPALGPA